VLVSFASTLLVMLSMAVNPIDAASLEDLLEQTRRHGEDALYVSDVAISLGLSHDHGVRVKHIEVRFGDNHRRFIAVTERDEVVLTYRRQPGAYTVVTNVTGAVLTALKRSVSGALTPMDAAEAKEALDIEVSFWNAYFAIKRPSP
jgi:hypothetical protein